MACGCKKNKQAEPTPQVKQITKEPVRNKIIDGREKTPERLVNEIVTKLKNINSR